MKRPFREIAKYLPFIVLFVLMCGFKLWFSMLLFIAFAVALTAGSGKRRFCSGYCPLGSLQDQFSSGKKHAGKWERPSLWPLLQWSVFLLFWGYLVLSIALTIARPARLWTNMLLLMLLVFSVAIVLQGTVKKRFWCSELCPVGKVLHGTARVRRALSRKSTD